MKISSTSSFDLNTNEATAGCLSGLLRRLLCRHFHPSTLHSHSTQEFLTDLKQEERKPPPSPNLVARLMGLDTMPVYPYTPTETIARSQSTNSIEGWNGFLSGHNNWASKHQTSHSFREEPTFLRKESAEFLVLSFTPDEKGDGISSNGLKPKIDHRELKELKIVEKESSRRIESRTEGKENAKIKNSKPKPFQRKESHGSCPRGANKENFSNAKKRSSSVSAAKKLESEPSSQDFSPVSVLDRHSEVDSEYITRPDSPISDEEKKPEQAKSRRRRRRRKLSSSELKSDSYPSNKLEQGLKINANGDGNNRGKSSSERTNQNQEFSDSWAQICQLAAEDVKRSCWDFEDNEEIAVAIGVEILDLIVNEVIITELYL